MAKKGKKIKANVEFYKGPVFNALGIPPEYFTALFAMSRVFGYLAHVLESRETNRLIRPKAYYVRN
jgi:citrate synthase